MNKYKVKSLLPELSADRRVAYHSEEQLQALEEAYGGKRVGGARGYSGYFGETLSDKCYTTYNDSYPWAWDKVIDFYEIFDEEHVDYVSVGGYPELNRISDYLFHRKWRGFAEADTSNFPLYLKVIPDEVQWSNTPFTNVLSYTPVHEFIDKEGGGEESGPDTSVADFILQHKDDEELHKNSKYTITANGVTIEIKGKITITGPEGTWTIGQ